MSSARVEYVAHQSASTDQSAANPVLLTPGLCSVTLRDMSIGDVVRVAASAKLAGIEWSTQAHVLDPATAIQARYATLEAGLKVLSLGSYYRVGSAEGFGAAIELASILRAPRIRVWAGALASADATPAHWREVVDDAQRIADIAAQKGVDIAFEYHAQTLTDSVESTLELLARVDRSNVGTYWQPGVGLTDSEAAMSLQALLPYVVGVHCFSWWPERERLPLESRKQLWASVLRIVEERSTPTDVMLEFVQNDLPANVIKDGLFLIDFIENA